ncbi:MAG TPA: SHOCT domain-containing protein, partial [Pseudonocardia sp.]
LPFIGVLIYLVAQGRHVGERRIAAAEYASSLSTSDDYATDQIIKAKQLLDSGAISDDEYQALKRQALASAR